MPQSCDLTCSEDLPGARYVDEPDQCVVVQTPQRECVSDKGRDGQRLRWKHLADLRLLDVFLIRIHLTDQNRESHTGLTTSVLLCSMILSGSSTTLRQLLSDCFCDTICLTLVYH